jgi:hypothetical protein
MMLIFKKKRRNSAAVLVPIMHANLSYIIMKKENNQKNKNYGSKMPITICLVLLEIVCVC